SGGGAQNTGGGDLLGDHRVDDRGFTGAGGSADHDDHRNGYLPQPREETVAYLGGKPVAFGAGNVGTWHVQWKGGGVQIGQQVLDDLHHGHSVTVGGRGRLRCHISLPGRGLGVGGFAGHAS